MSDKNEELMLLIIEYLKDIAKNLENLQDALYEVTRGLPR